MAKNLVPFTSDKAREAQRKSVEQRKRNQVERKTIISDLDKMLSRKIDVDRLPSVEGIDILTGSSPTVRECVIAAILLHTINTGKVEDLVRLSQLLNEGDRPSGFREASLLFEALEREDLTI